MAQPGKLRRFMYVYATGQDSVDIHGGVVEAEDVDKARAQVACYEELITRLVDVMSEDDYEALATGKRPLSAAEEDALEETLRDRDGVMDIAEIPETIGGIISLCYATNG